MTIRSDFVFTQANLQDYVECRRRFQLRYIDRLAWPAMEAEPLIENERRLQMGALFHRLIHQHLIGLPLDRLAQIAGEASLQRWWDNYLSFVDAPFGKQCLFSPGVRRYAEYGLSTPFHGFRLAAKYDVIALNPGDQGAGVVILDWKTMPKLPSRQWLANRLQTRLYPYLLVKAGAHLNGGKPITPKQVEMVYWFADFPDQLVRFGYSEGQYRADVDLLATFVEEIAGLDDDSFWLTEDERRCRFCTYRSLCDRGVKAGQLGEMEIDLEPWEGPETSGLELDFDQLPEIAF